MTTPKHLNDNWTIEGVPTFDKDTLLSTIILKGAQFEPLFTDPNFYYMMCGQWWKKWYPTFSRWAEVLNEPYHALWDRDGYEVIDDHTKEQGTVDTANTIRENVEGTNGYNKLGTNVEATDGESTYNKEGANNEVSSEEANTLNKTNKNEVTNESANVDRDSNGSEQSNSVSSYTKKGTDDITTTDSVSAWNENPNSPFVPQHRTVSDEDTTDKGSQSDTSEHKKSEHTDEETTGSKVYSGEETAEGNAKDNKVTNAGYSESGGNTDNKQTNTNWNESGNGIDNRVTNTSGITDTDTTMHKNFQHVMHQYGNFGLLNTMQKLLEQELRIRYWNIYDHMSDIFLDEMAVRVY